MCAENPNHSPPNYPDDRAIHDFPRMALSILAKISSCLGDLLIWPVLFHTFAFSPDGIRF
jgi:hypothetical protein